MKVYWITGASSGIGYALAKEFGLSGNRVVISGRNHHQLSILRESLPNPTNVKIVLFDQSTTENCEKAALEAWQAFGKIDVVVLNAGISQRSLVRDTVFSVFKDLMNVNYFGNVAICLKLFPLLVKQNGGHIVVISSLLGKFGTPFRSGYSASKHALHGFFDSLRAECMAEKLPIDVTLICPGFVDTNISMNALTRDGNLTGEKELLTSSGMKPTEFSKKAIKVIERKEHEAVIGGREVLGVWLKRFFPGSFNKLIARVKVR